MLALTPFAALSQGANVAFGGFSHDTTLPVEVSADSLQINQADGSAQFVGNVVIGQGEMRITAGKVRVEYSSDEGDATGQISRLIASGGVTLVNGAEAAEAQEAVYTIATGKVMMSGGVILTQGRNALSAERLVVNLKDGTGVMEGRVKSIIQTTGN
ncbi:MAG TPA: lipopolysaccharide transport periplasmic protein LptA [Aliiroseovarius sp.]|nr:lipopolysaccharide transport periplasmic protein LptA [Aliiroseovarius sp.]